MGNSKNLNIQFSKTALTTKKIPFISGDILNWPLSSNQNSNISKS